MATASPIYNPPLAGGGVASKDDGVSVSTSTTTYNFKDGTGFEFVLTDVGGGVVEVVGNATGGGGGGAPDNAQYVTLATNATLSAERVLTPEATVLSLTDGGAGAAVTLGVATAGITYAKIQDVAARSLVGRAANSSGVSAAISGGGAGTYASDNATSIAFRAVTDIIQNLNISGDISPTQLTADVDDYNPTSLSTSTILRLDSDASRNITGIAGGADGRVLGLVNIGSNAIVLKDASASSSAANRFALGADCTLLAGHAAIILYDSTSSRWRGLARFFPFTAAPVVTLTAGAGLTGGGTTASDRTFDVAANADASIVVNANDIQVGVLASDAQHGNRGGGGIHANAVSGGAAGFMSGTDKAALDAAVPNTRTVTAGAGLTGGGDLSANRTFDVAANADGTIVVNANDIQVGALVIGNVPDALITDAKLANMTARSVKGRSANSTGVPGTISGAGASTFLSDDASTLAFRVVSDIPQNLSLSGDLSPSQITSNQNDYNPTNLSTALVLRLDTDANRTITGLQGGADGRIIIIDNIGSSVVTLSNQNASSSAANRFLFGYDISLLPARTAILQYDSTASRWKLRGGMVEQVPQVLTDGATITPNLDLGRKAKVTLGGNRTLAAPTGAKVDGMFFELEIIQDGTGSRTLTPNTGAGAYRATEVAFPTLSTGTTKIDRELWRYSSTDDRWDLVAFTKAA